MCDKVSNEKRHIRTHTMSAHSISLDALEAENGDCEIHTEYFFCAVCHAEVKHCHRNILMHLQRSHNLTTAEYEAKYGEVEPGSGHVSVGDDSFGQHFLITDGGGNLLQQSLSSSSPAASSVVSSSSGKVVQGGGARRSGAGGGGRGVSDGPRLVRGTGNVPCEDCGRMFSTHSNKERHKREHCANMKLASMTRGGVGMGHTMDMVSVKRDQVIESDKQEELRCPLEGCSEEFVRSVHLKRHLTGVHNIQNPLLITEADPNHGFTEVKTMKVEVGQEERVPPLKIKINPSEVEMIGEEEEAEVAEPEDIVSNAVKVSESLPALLNPEGFDAIEDANETNNLSATESIETSD